MGLENVVKKNKDLRESAKTLKTSKMTDAQAQNAFAEALVNKILTHTKQDGIDPLKLLQQISKNQLRSDKLIRTGEELPDAIKRLLGEEDNLKASVLQTTSHAITQAVNKQTYDELAKIGLEEGWLFADEASKARNFDAVKVGELKGLGILKSKISKLYASKDMAAASKVYQELLIIGYKVQLTETFYNLKWQHNLVKPYYLLQHRLET